MKLKKKNLNNSKKTRKYLGGGKPLKILFNLSSNCSKDSAINISKLYFKLLKNNYDVEKAKELINEKNENGMNALRIAYENNCDTNFNVLLVLGAIDLPDKTGQTIVNRALIQNKLNYIEKILNKNAANITETEINTARTLFPPTGDVNIDRLQGNNIVEKLSRKAFEQGNITTIFPFLQRARAVPFVNATNVDIFDPTEKVNVAYENRNDYLGENGEGAYNLNGTTLSYPLDVPKAEPFRTNPLQLNRKPDPDRSWLFGGPFPGESLVRDAASRLRGTIREKFDNAQVAYTYPITDLNKKKEKPSIFSTPKVNKRFKNSSVPFASEFGGKRKTKKNKKNNL
uniref:Ankyrin repeat protein n=1 Tax=viral metagenome TaxID=1070528 RepID=A0A6C0JMI4_9ZZZZ